MPLMQGFAEPQEIFDSLNEVEEIAWECDYLNGERPLSERFTISVLDENTKVQLFRTHFMGRTMEFGTLNVFDIRQSFKNAVGETVRYHLTRLSENPKPKKGVIIISGVSGKKEDIIAIQHTLLSEGFCVIVFDHRGVGENRELLRTFGPLESQDILCLTKHLLEILPEINFGIFAPCLGAAIAMMKADQISGVKAFAFEGLYPDGERMLCLLAKKWAEFTRNYYLEHGFTHEDASPMILSESFPNLPLRVAWGGNDMLVSPDEKESLTSLLKQKASYFEVEIVKHAWHSLQTGFPLQLEDSRAYFHRTAQFFQRQLI
jgi:dienelactone hydrolase